jgi:hypothetical protein
MSAGEIRPAVVKIAVKMEMTDPRRETGTISEIKANNSGQTACAAANPRISAPVRTTPVGSPIVSSSDRPDRHINPAAKYPRESLLGTPRDASDAEYQPTPMTAAASIIQAAATSHEVVTAE